MEIIETNQDPVGLKKEVNVSPTSNPTDKSTERKLKAELAEYEDSMRNLADVQDTFDFSNSSAAHASVVMCNIFRTADDYVYIFAEDLAGNVSNERYVNELKRFMRKDNRTTLTVILEAAPKRRSAAIKAILECKEHKPGKITIGYANDTQKAQDLLEEGKKMHFTIADDRMYRKEIDTDEFVAKGSFNNPEQVKFLNEKFQILLSDFTPIDSSYLFKIPD
jgi:hypothetical protein